MQPSTDRIPEAQSRSVSRQPRPQLRCGTCAHTEGRQRPHWPSVGAMLEQPSTRKDTRKAAQAGTRKRTKVPRIPAKLIPFSTWLRVSLVSRHIPLKMSPDAHSCVWTHMCFLSVKCTLIPTCFHFLLSTFCSIHIIALWPLDTERVCGRLGKSILTLRDKTLVPGHSLHDSIFVGHFSS